MRDHKGESLSYNPHIKNKETTVDRGAILQKNSIIKLGRVRLRVCDIDTHTEVAKNI